VSRARKRFTKNTAIRIGQFWINKLSLVCACVVLGLGTGDATAQPAATAADTSITAIDILLLPDATMFQCFVHTADLAKVFAAADKVFASGNVTNLKLTAFKYYYFPDKDLGLSGIVIKPTAELIKLQSALPTSLSRPRARLSIISASTARPRKNFTDLNLKP
jgi:hypothetical protein